MTYTDSTTTIKTSDLKYLFQDTQSKHTSIIKSRQYYSVSNISGPAKLLKTSK